MFEIGLVFRRKTFTGQKLRKNESGLFLAVKGDTLVKVTPERVRTWKPRNDLEFQPCRDITVQELCSQWKISLERLDDEMAKFLTPVVTRCRPRANRREAAKLDEAMRKAARTVKLALASA